MDFQAVEIFKGERDCELGVGSYGAVYKAQCDGILMCAAKVLHPALFQHGDPNTSHLLTRFRQECDFLKGIRHPNIVQFLGVYDDPDFKLPVLLMELLDESLTKFLEKSRVPLPLYTQVNFSHDIALALAYLHSKKIVHRDLSSNNVLLVAGRKAKVTDFGMSKLLDSTAADEHGAGTHRSLTYCPGTEVYMPPEALSVPPDYTNKIDCFSLGPLMIQIVTRQYPKPTPRTEKFQDPRSPSLTSERPVLESIRRESHLKLFEENHPLRDIINQCLNYLYDERPSSQEICQKLETIKQSDQYKESEIQFKRKFQEEQQIQWEDGEKCPHRGNIAPGSIAVDGSTIYIQLYQSTKVYSYKIPENCWTELQDCQKMGTALVIVNKLLTAIGGYLRSEEYNTLTSLKINGQQQRWIEELPRMPTKRYNTSATQYKNLVIVTGGLGDDRSLKKVEILDISVNPKQWFVACNLPVALSRHSSIVCDNRMYLLGGIKKVPDLVHCDLTTLLLNSLPSSRCIAALPGDQEPSSSWHVSSTLPTYFSYCCILQGKVIAIGGCDPVNKTITRNIYQYTPNSDTWTVYTEMPNPRSLCLATVSQDCKIVVIGGKSGDLFTDSVLLGSL